jgi:hypothetical protein
MTAWTTITNALVAVGAKPFASTMQALRDNVVAAFEGDPTAVAAGVTLRAQALERLIAGDSIRLRNDTTSATTTGVSHSSQDFMQAGTIRITTNHRVQSGADTSEATIIRRRGGIDTTMQTWTTSSTAFVLRTYDAAIRPGDTWSVRHRRSAGVSNQSEMTQTRFSVATGQHLFVTNTMMGLVENPLI